MNLRRSFGLLLGLVGGLLASGAAQAGCELEKVATLPAKIDKGRVFIPGAIDGQPVDFLVDLAARTTLLRIQAERMTIRPDNLGSLNKVATFGPPGPDQMVIHHLPLRLGGTLENFGAPQEVAVLGTDFFGYYDVEFDVAHEKITLYKPAGCETANLGYWPGPKTVADMVSNTERSISNQPPFTAYNFPHINIRLKVSGQDMIAAIDSGYAHSSLSLAGARSVGLTAGGPGTTEVARTVDLLDGQSSETWAGSVESIAFGQETIAPAKIEFRSFILPEGAVEPRAGTLLRPQRYHGDDVMLGADFLISHRVFLAQSQNKVYFSAADGTPFL
jgi:predicted aspartyl protease